MAILSLDYETASTVDLRRIGAHAYARHPSTRVLCLAWAFDDEPVTHWRPGQAFPMSVLLHVAEGGMVRGWNVVFEWLVWNHVMPRALADTVALALLPELQATQLQDTMAAAAHWGLPLGLDAAAKAAKVNVWKDADGHKLMLQMCRPRRYDPFTGEPAWWHVESPERYDRLCLYCQGDVEAERAVALAVPPLPPTELRYWSMDLEMNARGVPLDTDLVTRLRELALQASRAANTEVAILTDGTVPATTNAAAMQRWLGANTEYPFPTLRKENVAERLDDPLCQGIERRVLSLRADTAKTSAAKLQRMLQTVPNPTGIQYVRGMLQYYGAVRTGRWAGRLIQLQNLPRGTVKGIDRLVDLIESGHGLDLLEAFGAGLDIVSSALRACICAMPGMELFVADFSQIEARMLAWLAGQQDMLKVYRDGEDPYLYTAARQGSTNRTFGKVLVLALGYGMGAPRFRATAKVFGVELSEDEAEVAVYNWREDNRQVRQFWWDIDAAAKATIRHHVHSLVATSGGNVELAMWRGHLLVKLPSGHLLVYRETRLEPDPVRPEFDCVTYMGINQYTRQWARLRTWGSKIVENITQALARDVMAEAAALANTAGLGLFLMVHDELIGETVAWEAEKSLLELLAIMRTPPPWAKDLPVEAVGWHGIRYHK